MNLPIYLDYNGTTPIDPEVRSALLPYLDADFGNPSSSHWYGIAPKRAILQARRQVSGLLAGRPEEILFTSGGTESNNHALIGVALANRSRGNHLITSCIEHPAILEVCRFLELLGFGITYLPVNDLGLVSAEAVKEAITPHTILITVMHANNEVGTIQPIAEISQLGREAGVLVHTDAAQSVGKIPVNVQELGVDLLSVAGHKLYAPKGVGALYIREGVVIDKFMLGAGQEAGRRAGTENVAGMVALGKACEIAQRDLPGTASHLRKTRDLLEAGLEERLPDIRINGDRELRLPNTSSISFLGTEANRILEEIGLDVAASAGAACHSDFVTVSHVLEAMNVPIEWAKGTLRFTTGRMTTEAEIRRAVEVIVDAVKQVRG